MARAEGRFKTQIVPIEIPSKRGPTQFDVDEHVRAEVTLEQLAQMKALVDQTPNLPQREQFRQLLEYPNSGQVQTILARLPAVREQALEEIPVLDMHTHLVGGRLAARGLHDVLLYHMMVTELYAAGCASGRGAAAGGPRPSAAVRGRSSRPTLSPQPGP